MQGCAIWMEGVCVLMPIGELLCAWRVKRSARTERVRSSPLEM